MRRRSFLRTCVPGTAALFGAPMLNFGRCRLYAGSPRQYSVRAVDIVGRSIVIDMLGLLTTDWQRLSAWHKDPSSFTSADYAVVAGSGVDVLHPAVDLNARQPYAETREWLMGWNRFLAAHRGRLRRVDSCADMRSDRTGVLLGMQNSDHFRSADDVPEFHAMGQRVSQLTYNGPNRIGHGCIDRVDHGLTPFGATIIRAMNQCGMAVDISHAGERTSLEACELSRSPVLVTHANCKALVPHPRCKSDAVIRAMARTGGVMGITSVAAFVARQRATLHDALDHFDHVRRVAGVEHAGLGSDAPLHGRDRNLNILGLNHPRRVFDIADGLLRRHYRATEIELILGGNFRRALGEIFC